MKLSPLEFALWLAGFLLNATLVVILVVRGRWRRFRSEPTERHAADEPPHAPEKLPPGALWPPAAGFGLAFGKRYSGDARTRRRTASVFSPTNPLDEART